MDAPQIGKRTISTGARAIVQETRTDNDLAGKLVPDDALLTILVGVHPPQDDGHEDAIVREAAMALAVAAPDAGDGDQQLIGFEHLGQVLGAAREHRDLLGHLGRAQRVAHDILSMHRGVATAA